MSTARTVPDSGYGWHCAAAARVVVRGGIIAYPTEAVFGVGCDPLNSHAVARILALKVRDADKGLIVIAADPLALFPFVDNPTDWFARAERFRYRSEPVTLVLPKSPELPELVTGGRETIACRVVQHPIARALCERAGPLVSTSANISGRRPARNLLEVRRQFKGAIDYLVPGAVGTLAAPTPIIDVASGRRLR